MKPRYVPLLVLMFFGGSCAPYPQDAGHSQRHARHVIVIAHRGAHASAPENTLPAIARAIELGCDFVEVDVRQTKDGALVLMHDRDVDRTTNGSGELADLTLSEVRGLQVTAPGGGLPENVPTFDEALDLCRGRIGVLVDNKSGVPGDVIEALRSHRMLADIVVYDSVADLREFRRLSATISVQPPHPGSLLEITRLVADLQPETLDGNAVQWNREQVDATHRSGAQVWVDNLGERDHEAGVRMAVDMNVDAIQTDFPEMTLRVLGELRCRNTQTGNRE